MSGSSNILLKDISLPEFWLGDVQSSDDEFIRYRFYEDQELIIRVLLVDADSNSLLIMENLMTQFSYLVTKYENAVEAIDFLKKSKNEIDLVIWDFHMPDISGLEALNTVGKEMDLPFIIMSHDYKKETVINSIHYGALDFLVKPVGREVIAVLWRHVLLHKTMSKPGLDKPDGSDEGGERTSFTKRRMTWTPELGSNFEVAAEKDSQNTCEEKGQKTSLKNVRRMKWSSELHHKFQVAVEKVGGHDKAVPTTILKYMEEEMNVQGLTTSIVASHLQKYRHKTKKKTSTPQETPDGNSWPNAALAASTNTVLNSSIELNARASYVMNNQAAVNAQIQHSSNSYLPMNNQAAVNAQIQHLSNSYLPVNNQAAVNAQIQHSSNIYLPVNNPSPYIGQFQQPQQPFYSSMQESGHVSPFVEDDDELIYNISYYLDDCSRM